MYASQVQAVLGDGWVGGEWARVNTAIIERVILRQTFTEDEWLQMFTGDHWRMGLDTEEAFSLRTRINHAASTTLVVGAAGTLITLFGAMAMGQPEYIFVPAGTLAVSLASAVASKTVDLMPDAWLTWVTTTTRRVAVQASTLAGSTGVVRSTSYRRAQPAIAEYKRLFAMTQSRVEELRQTAVGRLGLLYIREIIGQESGTLEPNPIVLELLSGWVSFFRFQGEGHVQEFNEFCMRYSHDDFDSFDTALPILDEFNRFMQARRQVDQEMAAARSPATPTASTAPATTDDARRRAARRTTEQ